MAVKYGFPILFAKINQAFFAFIMVSRNGCNLPAAGADQISAVGDMEVDGIVNGMGLEAVNQDVFIESFFDCFIAINIQHAFRAMAEVFMPVDQIRRKPVIHMAVRD